MTEMIYGSMRAPVKKQVDFVQWWDSVDRISLFAILALFALGMLLSMAASIPLAQKNGLPQFYYVFRQLLFGTVALGVMLVFSRLSPTMVRRLGVLGFLAAGVTLLALPVIGTDFGKGATRWLSLGFASVQPSEFFKPGFVIMAAWMIAAGKEQSGPPGRIMATMLTGVFVIVLVLQPDFGQASLTIAAYCAMMFVAGTNLLWMLGVGGVLGVGAQFAYTHSEHFARRIDGFLSGEIDPHTQIGYAANAISNGGVFGAGAGEGTVKYSLPDAHTDFIVAVAAEEYGLWMIWLIVALFAVIVARSFWNLTRARDHFVRLAGTGLVTLIGAQSMINLAVSARLVPNKGMTLPFISYGGSSLVAIGITFGFLLALTRRRPDDVSPV